MIRYDLTLVDLTSNFFVLCTSYFSFNVGVVRAPASGILRAHKTPSFLQPVRLRKRSSGCSPPLSYACPYWVKVWGIVSLNFWMFCVQMWKFIYIIIHSGWSLAWIFMKERVKQPWWHIKQGKRSNFCSEPSSTTIFYVCKEQRLWQDCASAQVHLSPGCSPMQYVPKNMYWPIYTFFIWNILNPYKPSHRGQSSVYSMPQSNKSSL